MVNINYVSSLSRLLNIAGVAFFVGGGGGGSENTHALA